VRFEEAGSRTRHCEERIAGPSTRRTKADKLFDKQVDGKAVFLM
jgi:hypothetical protein